MALTDEDKVFIEGIVDKATDKVLSVIREEVKQEIEDLSEINKLALEKIENHEERITVLERTRH